MEKKVIIGIDVSKSWLDAHVLLLEVKKDTRSAFTTQLRDLPSSLNLLRSKQRLIVTTGCFAWNTQAFTAMD